MKIQYQTRGLNSRTLSDHPLARHLEHLDGLISISEAQVFLEHHRNMTPAFSASVNLAVPGPDIHVAARDHTLEAVLLKIARRIEEKIEERNTRQQLRLKGRRQCRRVPCVSHPSP
jgi:hypothetical protein